MIKGIGFQKVDVTEQEFVYYKKLVKVFSTNTQKGTDYFIDLFEVDNDGLITIIKPIRDLPWSILFFVQNLMINQRLRLIEDKITIWEDKINGRLKE